MRTAICRCLVSALVLLAPTWASAADEEPDDIYIGANLGAFGIVKGQRSAALGVEVRGKPLLWKLYPHAGGFVTHRRGAYGYGGFGVEFRIAPDVLIRGNTAVGAYLEGNDRDLGHPLEFRSGLEFVIELPHKAQLALTFHHLSNAGIGEDNPGAEIAGITYSVPLDSLF